MFDFAVLAIGRADQADRITAVALNFEMKGERFASNGHQISTLNSNNQVTTTQCMATNEIQNGCESSIEAVLASNHKRRCAKTAVLKHPAGERPLFHPRYLDFAAHYGFEPRACNVRRPNEKGRVESGVGYVKKNFLDGLQLPPGLNALNTAARHWMETVANVRVHGETHKQPIELFALEKPHLNALPPLPADTGVIRTVPTSSRFRVVLDTNRYSVPSLYASQPLLLKTFADRLCIYHGEKLIATHTRSYDRHQDFEDPDHCKELLDQRRAARDTKLLLRFYGLCPRAEEYYLQLQIHRL